MSHTNYDLTRPHIFFRVKERNADVRSIWKEVYGQEPPARLAEFTRAFLTPGTKQYRRTVGATTEEQRKELAALTILARALTVTPGSGTSKDLYDAARLLINNYPLPRSALAGADSQDSAALYAGLLNLYLRETHLAVIAPQPGELPVPCVVCPNIRVACFVWAAYRGLQVCAGCGRAFTANPERNQKFCSTNCAQRIYQRRHRRRMKSRLRRKR